MEKDFKVPIHLPDSEFCNGCVILVTTSPAEPSKRYRCAYFNKPLTYDVRRRVGRLEECFKVNG